MNTRSKEWRSSMRLTVNYNYMMKKFIGEDGLRDADLTAMKEEAADAFAYVKENRGKGMMGWTELPYDQKEIVEDILATAKEVRRKFKYFVVLGIGGSALGPIAVFNALCHLHYNELAPSKRRGPKFYVEDNVDPERMKALLDVIEPEKTCFNVITKSGATSETMAQYLIISDILNKALGDKASEHIIATTDHAKGNLIKLSKQHGYKTFYIPDGVGGRFSELCPVGLLPAAVLGLDIKADARGRRLYGRHLQPPVHREEPRSRLRGAAGGGDAPRQERRRHDALRRQPQADGGLVLPALGGEPGQERHAGRQALQRRADARQVAGRDRPALAGAAVHGRPLR